MEGKTNTNMKILAFNCTVAFKAKGHEKMLKIRSGNLSRGERERQRERVRGNERDVRAVKKKVMMAVAC